MQHINHTHAAAHLADFARDSRPLTPVIFDLERQLEQATLDLATAMQIYREMTTDKGRAFAYSEARRRWTQVKALERALVDETMGQVAA
jgi:ClpP class serine protease